MANAPSDDAHKHVEMPAMAKYRDNVTISHVLLCMGCPGSVNTAFQASKRRLDAAIERRLSDMEGKQRDLKLIERKYVGLSQLANSSTVWISPRVVTMAGASHVVRVLG